jgi:hypothetical protein
MPTIMNDRLRGGTDGRRNLSRMERMNPLVAVRVPRDKREQLPD